MTVDYASRMCGSLEPKKRKDEAVKRVPAIAAILLLTSVSFALPTTRPLTGGKISKPETAAQKLYSAWKRNKRSEALQVASSSAVNKIFKTRYTGPDWEFNGCEKRGAGYDCFYRYEGGGVSMRVVKGKSVSYSVEWVSFIAD
jgi:hypothetical protein